MFGPGTPVYQRVRTYRRRLLGAHVVAAVLLAIAIRVVDYEPHPYVPDRAGWRGPLIVVEHLDETTDEISDEPRRAGGHPLPRALEAIDVVETPAEGPEQAEKLLLGRDEIQVPEVETPIEAPAVGDDLATKDTSVLSITSAKIVVLEFVKPPYPTDARLLGVEGTVTVRVLVGADGRVVDALTEGGEELLPSCVEAALGAAKKWRFEPISRNGTTGEFWVKIPFRFRLGRVSAG